MRVNLILIGALTILMVLTILLVSCGGSSRTSAVTPTMDNPAAADQALAQELTLELERQLKTVSRTQTPVALVWYVARTRTLYWVLKGDYNLDGVVSIGDVTPVAIYFGTGWGFPTSEVVPWWVDGDRDHKVSIADITPIAMYFGNVAPRWVTSPVLNLRQVEHRAMWAVDLPDGINWWEVDIWPAEPEPPNQSPIAVFTASPLSGEAPLTVSVDGTSSYDPDGIIVEYRWYFHGGGGTFIGGNIPTTSYTYNAPGTYSVWLVVVDDDGKADWSDEVRITVREPQPPPPTYELLVAGTDGVLGEGGTLTILEGTSKLLNVWQLKGSDGSSTIGLSRLGIQTDTQLPIWVFGDFAASGEIATVLWANPENPDSEDPGNIFIEPGSYGVAMSVSYDGEVYTRNWMLVVQDRPDFP